jgi:hypothetical protein
MSKNWLFYFSIKQSFKLLISLFPENTCRSDVLDTCHNKQDNNGGAEDK